MNEVTPQHRARSLIERNLVMTLATVDGDGRPWVSPVFYSVDQDSQLYWVSDIEARHSANIRETGAVAVEIHEVVDKQTDAVYIDATAIELNDEAAVRQGMAVMAQRDEQQPPHWRIADIADVTGDGPWRIYRAARESTWVRDLLKKKGKSVVGRKPADF